MVQNADELKENVSVANNACWAIGELAIKVSFLLLTFIHAAIFSGHQHLYQSANNAPRAKLW